MNARSIEVRVPTLLALQAYLHSHPAAGSLDEVVDLALNAWLARQTASRQGDPGVGYHWKSLFLPAGTQVRFNYEGRAYHAEVVGDELIYRGKAVSPRGILMAVAGLSGNAWNLLRIRRPGDRHFSFASALRAQQARDDEAGNQEPENDLTRRVVDALGRIETRLRDQNAELMMQRAVHQERTRALNERSAESISIPPAPVVGFKDGAAADHAERAEGSHPEQVKPGQGHGTGGLQEHAQGNASDQVRATPNWQSGHSVTGDEARYDDRYDDRRGYENFTGKKAERIATEEVTA